ncbi:hypothetical protein AgCh_022980 [Apium graveolens]
MYRSEPRILYRFPRLRRNLSAYMKIEVMMFLRSKGDDDDDDGGGGGINDGGDVVVRIVVFCNKIWRFFTMILVIGVNDGVGGQIWWVETVVSRFC